MELNENGYLDTAYSYGNERLSADRFEGSSYYYLYEGRGSVSAVTGTDGYFTASYRYNAYGEMTFGKPQYENVYGYNGESYNPNLDGQYLRARYYHVEAANFFTEDSYLGDIREPLSLNRYNYVYSSYLNYIDPSGHIAVSMLNKLSAAYNSGLISQSDLSIATLLLNGKGIGTALHEIAQLNVAKSLSADGAVELEKKVQYVDALNPELCKSGEIDAAVVTLNDTYIWEIKSYGQSVSKGVKQILKYQRGGTFLLGYPVSVHNVHLLGDYYMDIDSDIIHSEILRYRLYKKQGDLDPVYVTVPEFSKEYSKRAALATSVFVGVTVVTVIEDVLTLGAGTADDAPSLLGGLGLAGLIFA